MARMATTSSITRLASMTCLGLALMAGTTGCVSQKEYDNLAEANLANSARLAELREENRALERQIEARQGRIGALESQIDELQGTRDAMRRQIAEAQRQYEEFESRLNSISLSGLDPETDRRLRELAATDPDLMQYDAEQGVIRFTSDLTFASGSANVRDSARPALNRLAGVLLEAEASGYDLMVVGHTDSQPISRSRDRHPTNRHLSAHRAIAVSEQLSRAGLGQSRILISGWGSHDPVVSNNPSGGTKANRRVEIFLMPADAFRTGNETYEGGMESGSSTGGSGTGEGGSSSPPIVK